MEFFNIVSEFDGLSIACARCDAEDPKAVVQLSHGMAEHKERYYPFMEYLAALGISSVINDHRGHGASVRDQKDLGYFGENGADGLLSDLNQITRLTREKNPGVKLFLLGHSMGALAVRAYIQKYGNDIDGLLVSGNPGYSPAAPGGVKMAKSAQAKKGKYARCRFLTVGMFLPFFMAAPSLKTHNAWICTDDEVVKAYDADPLCGFEFYANGYEALMTLMVRANDPAAPAPNRAMPVAFFSGEKDACMAGRRRLDESAELLRKAGYKDVSVKVYPGMRHEILNEKDRMTVWQDISDTVLDWCGRQEK